MRLILLLILASLHALASAARIDLYDVLDVPTSASQRELKRAYRKQARALHPDLCGERDLREPPRHRADARTPVPHVEHIVAKLQ